MSDLAGPWNSTTRGHGLDIAPLQTENQFGGLDRAALGESHAAIAFSRLGGFTFANAG
jgi:hypothetical protein